MFKMSFLSKWTVLILTLITIGLVFVGVSQFGQRTVASILVFVLAALIYAFAWIVALLDSIQEKKFGWSVGLVLLLPFFIGPAVYSLIGPKNTK